MEFAFLSSIRADRQVEIVATCVEVRGSLGRTLGEVKQGEDVYVALKHSVIFTDITLREAFKLPD